MVAFLPVFLLTFAWTWLYILSLKWIPRWIKYMFGQTISASLMIAGAIMTSLSIAIIGYQLLDRLDGNAENAGCLCAWVVWLLLWFWNKTYRWRKRLLSKLKGKVQEMLWERRTSGRNVPVPVGV